MTSTVHYPCRCACGRSEDNERYQLRVSHRGRIFFDGPRISQAEVEQLLVKGAFLLAEAGDKLNGCVYVELRGERSYLGLLSVDP